jgi:hypothetical protein
MAPLTNNEKKIPIVTNDNYVQGWKKLWHLWRRGEEKPNVVDNTKSIYLKIK